MSNKPNASIDTQLRKLQSILSNNVNTSYGYRYNLAQFLVNARAPHLMEKLAGQALSSWFPRGLGKVVASGMAGAEALAAPTAGLSALKFAPLMAAYSPRLMGETAYYGGRAASMPGKATAGTALRTLDADALGPADPNDALGP